MSNNKQSSVEKEFVPHEEALALKELGFDEPCFGYWGLDEDSNVILETRSVSQNGDLAKKSCNAPTYSQAFRWFREKYNIEGITQHAEDRLWYKFHISTYLQYGKKNIHAGFEYPTYEEAELGCLRDLIKLVKENENKIS